MKAKLKSNHANSNYKIIFVIVFAIIGVAAIIFSKAATPPTFGLYISPDTSSVVAGAQIPVSVYANLGSTSGIQSATAYIKYDPTLLRLDTADQVGVNPNFTITTRCTNLDGCKPAGEIVFVAGYGGTGTIAPSNQVLLGNLKFTALKTGSAALTLDPSTTLSGFTSQTLSQSTLDTRTLLNGTYSIVPTAPSGVTSSAQTDSSITLNWTASNDGASGANLSGYNIYRGGVKVNTSVVTGTTYTNTGLTPSTSYSYTVVGVDKSGGTSAASTAINVSTKADSTAPTVPGKPTAGTITSKSIVINWTASTNLVGVTGYMIYIIGTLLNPSTTVTATTYTDTGLNPSTAYSYTIAATDAAGNASAQSAATSITTAADSPPTTPTNLNVTNPSQNTVNVTWTASTDDNGVAGYQIYRGATLVTTTAAGTTSFSENLNPGTYSYTVKAVDTISQTSAATAAKSITIYSSYDPSKDGVVGVADLNIVLSNYGKTGSGINADVNGDGIVNILDISALLTKWGTAG